MERGGCIVDGSTLGKREEFRRGDPRVGAHIDVGWFALGCGCLEERLKLVLGVGLDVDEDARRNGVFEAVSPNSRVGFPEVLSR